MDPAEFRWAMRHCAGAVALVTVGCADGRRTGLTVTAVCSLSDDPPSLLVCVNRNASAHSRIREEGCFGVNFLDERHLPLALIFSGQNGIEGEDRFGFGTWARRATGAPLLDDAHVAFDCALREAIETKTHSVFVGDVQSVAQRGAGSPLIYLHGAFHGAQPIRDPLSLDDITARKLSWSGFS